MKRHTHVCSHPILFQLRGTNEQLLQVKQHIYNCTIKECAGIHNRFCVMHVPHPRWVS